MHAPQSPSPQFTAPGGGVSGLDEQALDRLAVALSDPTLPAEQARFAYAQTLDRLAPVVEALLAEADAAVRADERHQTLFGQGWFNVFYLAEKADTKRREVEKVVHPLLTHEDPAVRKAGHDLMEAHMFLARFHQAYQKAAARFRAAKRTDRNEIEEP